MRPVDKGAPANYPFTAPNTLNVNVPAFAAGSAMATVYNHPGGFQRTIAWVQNQLLDKAVHGNAFPNPSTPLNRARARKLMKQRLEAIYGILPCRPGRRDRGLLFVLRPAGGRSPAGRGTSRSPIDLHGADLVVLDEPTSGLDPVFRRDLLDLLMEILQGGRASILFSTHITADLDRIADYVTLLQRGRVAFSTSKDDILDHWAIVRGGLELLDGLPVGFFRGVRRSAHGFEAITGDAAAARARFGSAAIVERPRLDDVVLLTTAEDANA